MKIHHASLALIAVMAGNAHAVSLSVQENLPGNAGVPNYDAGGYISQPLGGGYTRMVPVTGPGQIVDQSRPSYTVHERSSLPPLLSSDPDGSKAREWLLNQ
jgi:hypothetical protein